MRDMMLADRYPILIQEFEPGECRFETADEVIAYFRERIEADALAGFIAVFDQAAHTRAVGGEVAPNVKVAKNIVFCFGQKLPNAAILAVKPRSIGVAEVADKLAVTFLEPPNEAAREVMLDWVAGLAKA